MSNFWPDESYDSWECEEYVAPFDWWRFLFIIGCIAFGIALVFGK
jgi:hypothetical protein